MERGRADGKSASSPAACGHGLERINFPAGKYEVSENPWLQAQGVSWGFCEGLQAAGAGVISGQTVR